MYEKNQALTVSFFYPDLNGNPVSGAELVALVRGDNGTWRTSTNAPSEASFSVAPGFYDLNLTAGEMNYNHIDWYVRTGTGVFVAAGQIETTDNPDITVDLIREAIFEYPTGDADCIALRREFMEELADTILRRSQAEAERSAHGDTPGAGSLLGVISLMTQGQMVATGCNGDSYIFINSAVQGRPALGALRVVRNGSGVPIGTLPMFGPNAIPDATRNCDCPTQ